MVVALVLALAATDGVALAHSNAKIAAPRSVAAPRRAHFSVDVSRATKRVVFYIDGRRRWVAHPRHRAFARSGYLKTSRMSAGRHRLRIAARIGRGRIVTAKRVLIVRRRLFKSSSSEHGKKKTAPAVPESESTTSSTESTSSTGNLLFKGDFENGFTGWHIQSLPERISLVSSNVFQGTQAARFEVQEGDVEPETGSQRSEVSGPTFNEGQDLYINDAFRVPSGLNTYSTAWQLIQQLHEVNWSSSPGMALFLNNNHFIRLGPGDSSFTFWQGPQLALDRWYDLTYRVKLSQDPSVGFVEVWLNGVPQTLTNGQTRMYGRTIQAVKAYLKAGIYRASSSAGTSVVEHDAIDVGTSLAAATAG